MFDDDIGKIISGLPESVNGIPISKFRLIAERYPCVSGVWIDMRVSGACVNPQGRIFLNPNIQSETVARFPLDGIEVDGEVTAWLTFFHECAHLVLNHIRNDATSAEIASAEKRMENWSRQEKEIHASVVIENQSEADRWAVSEDKQLKKEGLIS